MAGNMMNERTDEYEIKDNVFLTYNPSKEKDYFEIPEGVTEIAPSAFEGCEKLVEIYIPDSVKKIGKAAFKNCKRLEELSLPQGIVKIEDELFKNCSYLGMPAIPFGVKEIGREAFSGCLFEETKANIPATVEKIGEGAFQNNGYLKAITLPNYVSIEKNAFDEKTSIRNRFNYSDSKIKIKDGILTDFMESKDVKELEIPEGTIRINSEVFYNCEYLEKVTLPEGLQEIGFEAFFGCTGLQEINFPETLKRIEFRAFSGCESLEAVELGSNISKVDQGAFKDCDSLETLVIADKSADIAEDAFEGCYGLEDMTETMGKEAAEKEEPVKEAAEKEEPVKEAAEKEELKKEATEKETVKNEVSEKEESGKEKTENVKSEKILAEERNLKDNIHVTAAEEKDGIERVSFGEFRGKNGDAKSTMFRDRKRFLAKPSASEDRKSGGKHPLANIFSR